MMGSLPSSSTVSPQWECGTESNHSGLQAQTAGASTAVEWATERASAAASQRAAHA